MIYECIDGDTCCPKPIGFSCTLDTSKWPLGSESWGFARPAYSAATNAANIIPSPCCPESCNTQTFPTFSNSPVCCVDDTCLDAIHNDSYFEEFLIVTLALLALYGFLQISEGCIECGDEYPTADWEDIPEFQAHIECTK